jgi:hypothetical protein
MILVVEDGFGRVGERDRKEKGLWVEESVWRKVLVRENDEVCMF